MLCSLVTLFFPENVAQLLRVKGITFVNRLLDFLSDCSTLTCITSVRIILTSDLVSKTCLFK